MKKSRILLLSLSLLVIISILSACGEQAVEAKSESAYAVTKVLDNVYYVECDSGSVNDAIKYVSENYSFYKVIDVELRYKSNTSYNSVIGAYVTVSQN